jgi:hypothetical protein
VTHQELLEKYARAEFAVMQEYYSSDKYPEIFQEVAIYAHENGLEFPEDMLPYDLDEDGFVFIKYF